MICQFSEPKSIGVGGIIKNAGVSDNFQFSKMECDSGSGSESGFPTYTVITSPTGSSYALIPSFTYGELLIGGFLSVIFSVSLLWGIYLLVFRRKY
jgi:hypothetical protein